MGFLIKSYLKRKEPKMSQKPFPNTPEWKEALKELRRTSPYYILAHAPYVNLANHLTRENIPWLPAKGFYHSDMGPNDGYCDVVWFCVPDPEKSDNFSIFDEKIADHCINFRNESFPELIEWIKKKANNNPSRDIIEKKIMRLLMFKITSPDRYEKFLKQRFDHTSIEKQEEIFSSSEFKDRLKKGVEIYHKDLQRLENLLQKHLECCDQYPTFLKEWKGIREDHDYYYIYHGRDEKVEKMLDEMNLPWIHGKIHFCCTKLPYWGGGYYGGPYKYQALWICQKNVDAKKAEDDLIDCIETRVYGDYNSRDYLENYIKVAKQFHISKWVDAEIEKARVYSANKVPGTGDIVCFGRRFEQNISGNYERCRLTKNFNKLYFIHKTCMSDNRYSYIELGTNYGVPTDSYVDPTGKYSFNSINVIAFEETWKEHLSESYWKCLQIKIDF